MDQSLPRHHIPRMRQFWRGRREVRWKEYSFLLGGISGVVLYRSIFVFALSMLWRETLLMWVPAVALVGLSMLLLLLGLRAVLYSCVRIGIQRLVVVLPVLLICGVLIAGVVTPGDKRSAQHWTTALNTAWAHIRQEPGLLWSTIQPGPENIRLALAGTPFRLRETGIMLQLTPAHAAEVLPSEPGAPPGSDSEQQPADAGESMLSTGTKAQVVRTGPVPLRARQDPSLSSPIVHRFRQGTILVIIDGPVIADGFTWWQVEQQGKRGWCVQDYLDPTQ